MTKRPARKRARPETHQVWTIGNTNIVKADWKWRVAPKATKAEMIDCQFRNIQYACTAIDQAIIRIRESVTKIDELTKCKPRKLPPPRKAKK